MAQPKIISTTNTYKVPKGNVFFNQLRDDGSYDGYRPLGNCPAFTISIATDTITHVNSQGGLDQTDFTAAKSITRSAKITCDNLSDENLKLFLSAGESVVTQSATPVTAYLIPNAVAGRVYQLGEDSNNPTGVRGIGSVTVSLDVTDAATRANTTAYAKGDLLVPATPNSHLYVVTVAGTSGGSIPTYPTNGSTVADGTATLKDLGLITVAHTDDSNYKLDTDLGLLSVVAGGSLDTAAGVMAGLDVDDIDGVSLSVAYTPVAQTRNRIATGSGGQLAGKLKFISDNPFGQQQDVTMSSVTLSPSGDLAFIGEDITSMDFDVGINQLDTNTAAIYIDGRPL
jgi:hypothetical protein